MTAGTGLTIFVGDRTATGALITDGVVIDLTVGAGTETVQAMADGVATGSAAGAKMIAIMTQSEESVSVLFHV